MGQNTGADFSFPPVWHGKLSIDLLKSKVLHKYLPSFVVLHVIADFFSKPLNLIYLFENKNLNSFLMPIFLVPTSSCSRWHPKVDAKVEHRNLKLTGMTEPRRHQNWKRKVQKWLKLFWKIQGNIETLPLKTGCAAFLVF